MLNGSINPVAFTIFNLEVRWYGIIIVFGMLVGLGTAFYLIKRKGLNADYALEMFLWAIPLALVGARLYYVLTTLERGWSFADVFNLRTGGLAIYGGLIGGVVGLLIFSLRRKVNFLTVLDIAAVSVIIGQAIGRYGNFVNQEAYGIPITNEGLQFFPIGVYIDHCSAAGCSCGGAEHWHAATFFYESFWNLAGYLVLLLWLDRKNIFTGFSLCFYLVYEGIGRSIIEGLRTDSLYFLSSVFGDTIRISQMLSIFMIIGGAVLGIILYRKKKEKEAVLESESLTLSDKEDKDMKNNEEEKQSKKKS